jgi:hypothetical protein
LATIKDKNERDFRLVNATSKEKAPALDFNKIKIGRNTLANDVTLSLDSVLKRNRFFNVDRLEEAIKNRDYPQLRAISNYFFDKSGIYSRLCRYMAFLYRYDWFITPLVYDSKLKEDKIIEGWYKSSTYLENCNLKKEFGEIALKVVKNGCFYGYKLAQKSAAYLQELPVDYCRSRFELNGKPAVEFNIKYFNDMFADMQYRLKVLKMFPKEFQKAYLEYQNGTLPLLFQGDERGWFLLDPSCAVKFNLSNSDAPLFISVIPAIIDLEKAKELDKKKMEQQILKIIIQKMPIDKNGDLIFDVEEAQQLHNNAVAMLGDAVGVDVLTTFADVEVADMADKGNQSSTDWLERMERSVFNAAGVSQNQFNTDGNIALEKSIANDEATMFSLILQFEEYANSLLSPYNKNPKRLVYKVQILPTTVYNYKDLSKQYKEQTMLGFSKLLPQVALGQSQTTVMATAYFENKLMHLDELFIPPQMSSTTSGKDSSSTSIGSDNKGGRPALSDDEKSTKTIQNIEAGG